MKLFCTSEGCNSSSDKKKDLSKYPWMADITFHTFPTALKNKKMRKRWLDMVRRQNFEPNYQSRLCSIHFVGLKGPTKDNPVPTLFSYNNYGGRLNTNRRPPPVREIVPPLTGQTTADTASVTDTVVTDTASVTLVDSNQHVPDAGNEVEIAGNHHKFTTHLMCRCL